MAKNKSSQQEDLTTKTGINVMSDLGFDKKPQPVAPAKTETVKKGQNVDNLADKTPVAEQPQAKLAHETTTVTNTAEPAQIKTEKPSDSKKSKLRRPDDPDKEDNICKISANISQEAKNNLEKYAKLYGYKKLSPFLNDLLERLDLYMD